MATSASFSRRRKSVVVPLTPPLQTMDDNPLSARVFPNPVDLIIPLIVVKLVLADNSGVLGSVFGVAWRLIFLLGIPHQIEILILVKYGEIPSIASRLRAVSGIHVRQMDKLSALVKRWESRSCQKVDNYKNDEDTMTRLRSFLNEMESLALTDKLYELKESSSHLSFVTKGLIRSPFFKPMDLTTTGCLFVVCYLDRVLVSER